MQSFPLVCRAQPVRPGREERRIAPCGELIDRKSHRVVPTGQVLRRWEAIDWDAECFGVRCPKCDLITEYTWAVPHAASPMVLLAEVPYALRAHAVLADRWRMGLLTSESPSLPLLMGWTMVHGVPAAVDVSLRIWSESHPLTPDVWPNGNTDAHMPGNMPNVQEGIYG